jgi:membrane associated rhomboid family serine protease
MRVIFVRRRRRPYITYALILANVLVYLLTSLENSLVETSSSWIETLAYVPTLSTSPRQWYRLFSAMFTHADFFHIFFNMYFLYIFGREVEVRLGRSRYLLLYLLSGLAATGFHTAFTPVSGSLGLVVPTIGASGAISGILAAHLFMFPGRRLAAWIFPLPPVVIPSSYYLLFWFATQVGYGYARFETGTAFFAHAGGFVAGILLLYLLLRRTGRYRPPAERGGLGTVPKAAMSLLVLALAAGAVYSFLAADRLTGVYLFQLHTVRGGHSSEDQAVYTMFENETISPSSDDPRVVFNRFVWAGLLQYRASYTNPSFETSKTVLPPGSLIPLNLSVRGSIKYDSSEILESFEGTVLTDVLLTDSLGRVRGIERDVEYTVSISSEEVAGNVGRIVVGPLALLSAVTAVASFIITATRSDELAAREPHPESWPIVPI